MNNPTKKIQVIREIQDEDKTVKEALEITKRFQVLPYPVINAILEDKLSRITVGIKR